MCHSRGGSSVFQQVPNFALRDHHKTLGGLHEKTTNSNHCTGASGRGRGCRTHNEWLDAEFGSRLQLRTRRGHVKAHASLTTWSVIDFSGSGTTDGGLSFGGSAGFRYQDGRRIPVNTGSSLHQRLVRQDSPSATMTPPYLSGGRNRRCRPEWDRSGRRCQRTMREHDGEPVPLRQQLRPDRDRDFGWHESRIGHS